MCFLLTFLTFLSLGYASFFPPAVNLTSLRVSKEPFCAEARCALNKIENSGNSNCSLLQTQTENIVRLTVTQEIRKDFGRVFFGRSVLYYCPDTCTVSNFFHNFWLVLSVQIEAAKMFLDENAAKLVCKWPMDYCSWWSYSRLITIHFTFVAFPTTFVFNWANLATLTKLISSHQTPAAALYLHRFEILTDVLLSVSFYFDDLLCHHALELFISQSCVPKPYVSTVGFFIALTALLTFINQRAILNLLSDRLSIVLDPIGYNTDEGKAIARKMTRNTLLSSTLFYAPFLIIYTFYPLFEYWFGENYFKYFITFWNIFYSLPPVFCLGFQIYRGYKYERAYSAFQNKKAHRFGVTEGEVESLKKDEREKRALLGGTLAINILTSCVNMLITAVAFPEYLEFFFIRDPNRWLTILWVLESFLNFMNGTSSFILHLCLLKPYRLAFLDTKMGKCFAKFSSRETE